MNFADLIFWELLAGSFGVVLVCRFLVSCLKPDSLETFDKLALLSIGLFLLLCVSWITFCIFLVVAIGTYIGLQWILKHREETQARYLFVLIPLQLLPLVYYKYADLIANSMLGLEIAALSGLIIPVGISFYTFQKVAFVIDTLHFKKPIPKFIDYMNFAGFFPQIVAGPIERRESLLPQMEQFRFRWSVEGINEGSRWLVLGFFLKCCLADNLAGFFNATSATNPYLIWLANVLFGLRIYYDFAGYSFIALGTARILGIHLTLNFSSPYCSTSSGEFWRRWHITLSHWFRDYLYVPLGGGRTRWWPVNVAVVFLVSGIWHGAGVNFVLWGALHGAFLIGNRLFGSKIPVPSVVGWLLTLAGSFFAWLAFYETRTSILWVKVKTLLTPAAYGSTALREALAGLSPSVLFQLSCFFVLTFIVLTAEWLSIRWKNQPYALLMRPYVLVALLGLTVFLSPIINNGFVYFAF